MDKVQGAFLLSFGGDQNSYFLWGFASETMLPVTNPNNMESKNV